MEQQLYTEAAAAPKRNGAAHCEMPGVTYSITELAEEFGLTTRAIRFYEDKGLLKPERKGQTRIYYPRDRARLTLIVRGKNVGLALSEIKEILSLYDLRDGCETQNRVAVDKFRKRIAQLHEQRSEIDLQIRTLEESCARLEAQIEVQVKEAKKSGAASAAAAKPAKTKKLEKAIV
ncbi:MAG: MerR family DNA-binding transcriptional regulator [Alphaproteobacteria bacterium]|nr:MerR family DNA-binding transcriptional regulator [Alphaproteobacteria bacterium]MDX5416528.1 MerR family DNA-binding transcriptional regulator [Alphaproteobacteria bacterium]MDX5493887.1 MerR family DNA-binding transcriptional regulator [Alphaproteobacteria bacterium]